MAVLLPMQGSKGQRSREFAMNARRCIPCSLLFSGINMPGMLVNASRPKIPTGPGYRGLAGIISHVETTRRLREDAISANNSIEYRRRPDTCKHATFF